MDKRIKTIITALLIGVLAIAAVPPVEADDYGDDYLTAFLVAENVTYQGTLEKNDDVDFFKFMALTDNTYRFDVILGTLEDSVLIVYHSDGITPIAENDDCQPQRLDLPESLGSCLVYSFSAQEWYYMAVRSWARSSSGSYSVLITPINPYPDDHGNDPFTASHLSENVQLPGTLEKTADTDFFSMGVNKGERLHMEVTLNGLEDSILTLYRVDEKGLSILRVNDDCQDSSRNSCLDYTFDLTGDYYLSVTSYNMSYTGGYLVHFSRSCLTCVVEAEGMVFMPNPLVSSQNLSLKDNSDSDLLNGERTAVTFNVYEPDVPGQYMLDGPYVTTRGTTNRAVESTPPGESPKFKYYRNDDRFKEVMAYYHIDLMQKYIQDTLGFASVSNRSVPVITGGVEEDNSYYDPFDGTITFGKGGVDDAEDAEIIAHEYGHAIQDDQVIYFGSSSEGSAMGEGFSDYWAASFYTAFSGGFQDECMGEWDAVSFNKPCLRRVDGTRHYPDGLVSDPHLNGEIWSAMLWEIRNVVGGVKTDRMVIQSHFYLDAGADFQEGSSALIQADEDLYGGMYECVVKDALRRRGLLDSPCSYRLHAPADVTLNGDKLCFIATAAYGTPFAFDINVLRDFRDRFLMKNPVGRVFMTTYYKYSPRPADYISRHDGIRAATRTVLKPIVFGAWLFVEKTQTAWTTLFLTTGLAGMIIVTRIRRKARKSGTN